jgi:hypothetical protein
MTKTRQDTDARNADNRGVIANEIVERSKVANDVLGPIILASLMSSAATTTTMPTIAGVTTMPREASVDDLLADPMMSALWRAYAITETDVRNLVADVSDRLKGRNRFCRPTAELTARCA